MIYRTYFGSVGCTSNKIIEMRKRLIFVYLSMHALGTFLALAKKDTFSSISRMRFHSNQELVWSCVVVNKPLLR
jgi:hypothetical protein